MKLLSFQEFVHYIKSINFILKEKIYSSHFGSHHSKNRGHEEENIEYREYQIGDNFRFIDWKTVARTEKYYIREGFQNSSRTICIWLDTSPSQLYFTEKFHCNYLLALGIAYIFNMQNDKVYLYANSLFDTMVFITKFTQLQKVYQFYLEFMKKYKKKRKYKNTEIQDSNKIASVLKKNNTIFWITDLYITNEDFCQIIHNIKRKNLLMKVIHVYDNIEWEIVPKRLSNIFTKYVDVENSDWVSANKIQNYKNIWEEAIKNRIQTLQTHNIPYFVGILEKGPLKIIKNLI